ncbi:MAG: radical SAM protein [Desulfobacterales bacterium]|nr:radical SAM protein [Desulfobacterales bacterium]
MAGNFLFIHVNEWATFDSPDAIPISQAYILAYLKKNGFSGRILGDYQDRPLQPALVRDVLRELAPPVVGFSVYEENINRVRLWARYVKELAPDCLVLLGGPQVTFMPASGLVQMDEADILCRGEGELVFLELARALAEGRPLSTVAGICFIDNNAVRETGPLPGVGDLDQYPSPYLEDVVDPVGKQRVILLSSRGCTSPCTFCYTTRASGRQVRFHSLDRVIEEMHHLKERGISDFWFADPNFAYSRKRIEDLLQRIIEEVPNIRFWCQTRYNLIDDRLLHLLQRAGAHTIAFGLESATPDVLKKIKKGLEPERMAAVIRQVRTAGIEVELFSLFGLPGETIDQAAATLDFVKANWVAIDGNSICQQLHIFHGIPITDDLKAHGVRPLSITKPDYLSICRDYETGSMNSDEIRRMGLFWRLNRADYAENIREGRNLFEVAGFISQHQQELAARPEAELMLTRIFLALEEYEAAHAGMERLTARFADDPEVRAFLAGPFTGYQVKRRGVARPGCKVIYDCKGVLDGKVVPATEAYYQMAALEADSGLLLDFEQGLLGLKAGRVTQCEVRFPADYGHPELAGRTVLFQIYLHQVLEPVFFPDPAALLQARRPVYRFHDLAGLREQNESLYYLVLRDSELRSLTQDMTDFLSLLNFRLRLGFYQTATEMVRLLPPDRSMHDHAGRILLANGCVEQALELLDEVAGSDNQVEVNRVKALIRLERYEEAERIAGASSLDNDMHALDLRVGLASLRERPRKEYLKRMDDLLNYQLQTMGVTPAA